MKKEFKVFNCEKCGTQIISFEDNKIDNKIKCCGENLTCLISNTTDASYEKHVPTYEIDDKEIIVKVNHVMEEEHYIEWIACVTENDYEIIHFEPYMEASTKFKYVPGAKLFAYCNKHGLWESDVK